MGRKEVQIHPLLREDRRTNAADGCHQVSVPNRRQVPYGKLGPARLCERTFANSRKSFQKRCARASDHCVDLTGAAVGHDGHAALP